MHMMLGRGESTAADTCSSEEEEEERPLAFDVVLLLLTRLTSTAAVDTWMTPSLMALSESRLEETRAPAMRPSLLHQRGKGPLL